jgi:alpha-ribazole phosphatase
MSLRLFLVRHGETAWNAEGRFQGQTDVPLSAVGLAQAEAIAARLATTPLDAIYASDLSRAAETAQAIARPHALAVRCDPRWREMSFGEWHGLTYPQMEAAFPETVAWWNADRVHRAAPGGETLTQLAARVQAGLDDVRRDHSAQTVLIASHGGAIRALLCVLLHKSLSEYWQFALGNTSLTEVEFQRMGPVLNRLNDMQHLEYDFSY